ncbi:MAG: hypothetical protein U0X75_20675 [Acidobacteriota bacterium]
MLRGWRAPNQIVGRACPITVKLSKPRNATPPDALVLSVHPELALAAGHAYHFGDFLQYQDGCSAVLSDILQEQLRQSALWRNRLADAG